MADKTKIPDITYTLGLYDWQIVRMAIHEAIEDRRTKVYVAEGIAKDTLARPEMYINDHESAKYEVTAAQKRLDRFIAVARKLEMTE